MGLAVFLEQDGEAEEEITLINDGDADVTYSISFDDPPEDERGRGPLRDDFGDILETYDFGEAVWNGIAYDGEVIWLVDHNSRMISVTLEGERIDGEVNIPEMATGVCWDGEALWLGFLNEPILVRIDREGNQLANIRFGNDEQMGAFGVAWDGENLWASQVELRSLVQVSPDGERLRTVGTQNVEGSEWPCIVYVEDHNDGHMWLLANPAQSYYQLNIEEDQAEVLQNARIENGQLYGIGHDDTNLWIHSHDGQHFVIDDGIAEPRWIIAEPLEGVIPANDEVAFTLSFNTVDMEDGIYEMRVFVELVEADEMRDDLEFGLIEISAVLSIESDVSTILGNVTDPATEQPIENVCIESYTYIMSRFSNEEGDFTFENLPLGDYAFLVTAEDYLPQQVNIELNEPGEFELNIEMLHSTCEPDIEEVMEEIGVDEQIEIDFSVANTGNGQLTYTTDLCLIGDANAAPWEIRRQINAGQILNDSRIQGAVWANENFYVAGSNDRNPQIYVLNRDGELIDQFVQEGNNGSYGFKDLTFDGDWIWGSGSNSIKAFSLEGEIMAEFEGPFNPTNNFAWDSDRDLLWVSSTTSPIVGIDREGNDIAALDRDGMRVYGLAYWPDDPDGHGLYVFHKVRDVGDLIITKLNPDNGNRIDVANLTPEGGGTPAGAFITNNYDIYSWVFMAVVNSGPNDRIDIWQLAARTDWMSLEPTEGVIEADASEDFTLTLDATGLPEEEFQGEIVFSHDGVGGETRILLWMSVGEGQGVAERILQLREGWSMVSVNVQPENNDIVDLTQPLVDQDVLLMVKDGMGRFYSPAFGFNNIPGWNVAEGYLIKMEAAAELTIEGIPVPFDEPIPLEAGWQMVSYYPRDAVPPLVAMAGIMDVLLLAKDGMGRFCNPEFNFCNMADFEEGQGYLMKMDEDIDLIWQLGEDELASNRTPQVSLPTLKPTDSNMSLLVLCEEIPEGEIRVYSNDLLVGSGVIQNGKCGIAVWGDDLTSEPIDGAITGNVMSMKLFLENVEYEVQFNILKGNGLYETDDFQVMEVSKVSTIPEEFGISSSYPNPFNSSTTVTYNILETGQISLSLYDLTGRLVTDLLSGEIAAGQHTLTIDGADLTSGVYVLQLNCNQKNSRVKITLLK